MCTCSTIEDLSLGDADTLLTLRLKNYTVRFQKGP